MKNKKASGADSEDDSDDCDIGEANCELTMVEGQICSVPYELYDLPDLKGVLSIETWNSFLTDEERFFLSSFLPDMDQKTFNSAMEELLGGSDLYFGNPVLRFYQKLRGGLYFPKVACCRECLMFVKRKRYHYSLRSYHENMIRIFTEMRRLWDQCGKELGINERLCLWSKRTRSQSLKLPDLNRVPSEEMEVITRLPYKMKLAETSRPDEEIFPLCGGSKGILKVKVSKDRIFQNHSPNLVSGEHRHQSVPKGLLKVVSKPPSTCFEGPDAAPSNNLLPIRATGSEILRDKTSTPFQTSAYSRTMLQKLGGGRVDTVAELPICVLNQQDTLSIFSERSIRRMKEEEANPSLDDSTDARQQDRLKGLGVSKYFTGQNLPTNQEQYACFYPIFPISKAKILGTGSGTTETTKDSSLRLKNLQSDANAVRKPLGILSEHNKPLNIKDDHMFSLTYKRRKVQRIHVA